MTTTVDPRTVSASSQPDTTGPRRAPSIVELRDVGMRYGTTRALTGLTFDVSAGEIVAILGPNGAGKTTAISIMLGLRRPTEGTVSVFGHDPLDRAVRERLGAMLQESGVPSTLHVGEVVDLFRGYYPVALPRDDVLAAADLLDVADRQVGKLSGGQRQRMYFALALAGDPDLLFLDEPTVGMDVAARHAFWDRIAGLAALGKTIVFSTHLLEEADAIATRIVVIDRGRVVASGTPTQVKARVAGKRIRIRGEIPTATLDGLPGATVVGRDGAYTIVSAEDAMPVLRTLMSLGSLVEEVTVEEAGLEAAFLGLTNEGTTR